MTTITTSIHTIFFLVGPTNSGKTHFAKNVLIPQLRKHEILGRPVNVQYLSSDDIRRDLLGDDSYHKYDKEMLAVSQQAFDLLFTKLNSVTTYPINAPFVIVDTMGLHPEFRQKVINLAREHRYNLQALVFDYKNREDFTRFIPGDERAGETKRLISKHIDRLHRDVRREVTKKHFTSVDVISHLDFDSFQFPVENMETYAHNFLPEGKEYVIIGDVHGCLDELKQLLERHEVSIDSDGQMHGADEKQFILVGDLIDKGYASLDVVRFVHRNQSRFHLVKGNHENFVYKHLRGEISPDAITPEFQDEFFQSITDFENDNEAKHLFYELVESAHDFLSHRDFIVTHAPCEQIYLTKMDHDSCKRQRNLRYPKRADYADDPSYTAAVEDRLSFLQTESTFQHPAHVFGHIAGKKVMQIRNKINIDTGCASGNRLTSVTIMPRKPFFTSVDSDQNPKIKKEPLFQFFSRTKEQKIDLAGLDPRDEKRIAAIARNKINIIAGTMAPSDKDTERNELESLYQGLLYYKNNGVEKVLLQPKYMGSRCQVYLFPNIDDCYAVSRNGFVIKHLDLSSVYQSLLEKFGSRLEKENIQLMILDGELLPWSALGKGLIEDQFQVIETAVQEEMSFLRENRFEEALSGLQKQFEEQDVAAKLKEQKKKELKKEFGDRQYKTYLHLAAYQRRHIPLEKQEELWKYYARQLEIYGYDGDLEYKPFSLLKIVYADGREETFFDARTEDVYTAVTDDSYETIDLSDPAMLDKAQAYFDSLTTDRNMEGVVIKPEIVSVPNVLPYIKVRNQHYLTIVYGYDYLNAYKYEKLIGKKRLRRKMKTSQREFELGKQMLQVPYHEISPENEQYAQVLAQMIVEVKSEKEIDPRL